MTDLRQVEKLAALCGLASEFVNSTGHSVTINTEYKIPMLTAMGMDIRTDRKIEKAIELQIQHEWSDLLPAVRVIHQGRPLVVPLNVPETRLNNTFRGELVLENKKTFAMEVKADSLEQLNRKALKSKDIVQLKLQLPDDIPSGYHQLTLRNRSLEGHCQLIVVPETCHEPEALIEGKKIWGSSIQLYSVRSDNNWGIGDFSDLKYLGIEFANQGADIIGLNPIHSLYPSNPWHCSPYSPSSRCFINPLYLDVTVIPDFIECPKINQMISETDFQHRLRNVREANYVEYEQVASLKYSILEVIFHHFSENHIKQKTDRSKAFDRYRRKKGESLELHATYEALFEYYKNEDSNNWGWPCWPEEYRQPGSSEVKSFRRKFKHRIHYFMFLQWQSEIQLESAHQATKDSGMLVGIYRDLAVGVDRGGADVWSHSEYYCQEASVGAPPDTVAPQGQNWGLPPFNPQVLKEHAYAPFIEMLQANMTHCGALRIDHVMGLLRLWWCPTDKTADYGVYVNYPMEDLLGIIKLESQRHQCLIFGEDLGTVPAEIEAALPEAHCYSNEVVLFSREQDRFLNPENYKSSALTCISNHDIPTLRAWWNCNDLDLRQQLGIYDNHKSQQEKEARHEDKKALLKTLQDMDELPWGVNPDDINTMGYSRELLERIHYYLAKTASKIISIQLEDILEMDSPVNIPGTSDEYPNWRRRLNRSTHSLINDESYKMFLKNITLTRKA